MASIRKRGNSYLIIVSRGYDYLGGRIKPAQKTVHPPQGLTEKQTQKWLNEQAVLYEMEVKHTAPVDKSITLAKYIEVWLEQVAPKKLTLSTLTRDKQDIRRILPKPGHYKLTDLNKDILRDFYEEMRAEQNWKNGEPLAEKTVGGHPLLPVRHPVRCGGDGLYRPQSRMAGLQEKGCAERAPGCGRGDGAAGMHWLRRTICSASQTATRWCQAASPSGLRKSCGRMDCRKI